MNPSDYQGVLRLADLNYESLRAQLAAVVRQHGLERERVNVVSARTLKPQESIGNPERQDFPLVKGREVMVEASLNGARGQAFTDQPGEYQGTIREVLDLALADNFQRAVFIAALNAVLRSVGSISRTIHCKDQEPETCARNLVDFVKEAYGSPRIAFVGLQPAMVDHLARHYRIRVSDMDPANQGRVKYGLAIEPVEKTPEMLEWADVVFATGSVLVNDTYRSLIGEKPLVFYGVTVTGVAHLTAGCSHYCHLGH
jgi:hypothetical protein